MFRIFHLSLLASALLTLPAKAASADIEAVFAADTVEQRSASLQAIEQASDSPEAQMALATWQAFSTLERFGQTLHGHGFRTPTSVLMPLMRLPVPSNEGTPEIMTYAKWRATLTDLVTGLDEAKSMLEAIDDDADFGIEVDLRRLRLDLDEDGILTEQESLAAILQALGQPNRRRSTDNSDERTPPPVFRFDRADAYWLQGYSNFLTANARMWLAHDFQQTFDASFGMFFPRSDAATDKTPPADPSFSVIMDTISFVHTINWPVIEPETRGAVRDDLIEMIRLSRLNWEAILAETDNDREWLPGPQQPGRHPLTTIEVTEETVAAWHEALDLAEDLLTGKRLLSHMRYPDKGFNFERFFKEPTRFDLVLTLTGPAAEPYLGTGDLVDQKQ